MPQPMEQQPVTNTMSLDEAKKLLEKEGYEVKNETTPDPIKEEPKEILQPDFQIYNRDLANGRFYFLEGDDQETDSWVPSVTTQLGSIHKGFGFNTWNRNYGHLAPRERDAKAVKGSHVHFLALERMCRGEEVTENDIQEYIMNDTNKDWRWSYKNIHSYMHSIRRYLWSFQQFWIEHEPTVVAIEYPIYQPDIKLAGRLDMIVKMKKTKAAKKESLVLVDLKTGQKYWTHGIQNSAYKVGWELDHPGLKIDYIASLYVRDSFRKDPTYDLSYQKFDYESFKAASKLWHKENQNVKGNVAPTLKPQPPKTFKLY